MKTQKPPSPPLWKERGRSEGSNQTASLRPYRSGGVDGGYDMGSGMIEWHRIETAPKDGTAILGWPAIGRYNEKMPAPMAWCKRGGGWQMIAAEGEWMEATHWSILPEPPFSAA